MAEDRKRIAAKQAYERYGKRTDFKNYQGQPMLTFEEMKPLQQLAWEDAADRTEEDVIRAARTCHEVNRAYCQTIGDNSQKAWDETRADIQASAIAGVRAFLTNPETTPEQSHEGWSKFKIADGWTYGPIKDLDKKTHPCLVPYTELPEAQRAKDSFFLRVCRSIFS